MRHETRVKIAAHVLLYLVLNTARVAELADFAHSATGVVAVLPDHVIATVRRADDVRPVQQTQLCTRTAATVSVATATAGSRSLHTPFQLDRDEKR